jgi:FMN phosphatase YigB (HAD superfamily)
MRHFVFLDAGGVLLDETAHEAAMADLLTGLISGIDPGYGVRCYLRDAEEAVYRFVPNVYRYIVWKRSGTLARYNAVWSELTVRWPGIRPPLRLMSGIEGAVETLSQSFHLGVLGQYRAELRDLLKAKNLLKFFSRADTQEEFSLTKPDPRYFEAVLRRAGAEPSISVMVGDRIDKDIIPAKMIGMKTVRVRTGMHRNQEPRIPEEKPEATIDDLRDLPETVAAVVAQ